MIFQHQSWQPLVSDDGRLVLVADVRLDNREELGKKLERPMAAIAGCGNEENRGHGPLLRKAVKCPHGDYRQVPEGPNHVSRPG